MINKKIYQNNFWKAAEGFKKTELKLIMMHKLTISFVKTSLDHQGKLLLNQPELIL